MKRTYFPGGPVVKASPPSAGHVVQSLVRQLRSHMPPGQKPKQKTNDIVTNSMKTLKVIHIKKKNLKKRRE